MHESGGNVPLLIALLAIGLAGWAAFGFVDVVLFFALIGAVTYFHRNSDDDDTRRGAS